jgi:SNF2 family DNA or RNA helicase
MDPELKSTYDRLLKIRERTELTLKPVRHLRQMIKGRDGAMVPLQLRSYQVQMVVHLLSMKRFIVGDDTGLGKTVETIAAMCHLWERQPEQKVFVITKKSSAPQWEDEIIRFTEGVEVFVAKGSPAQRKKAQEGWLLASGPAVLIESYQSAAQDFSNLQDLEGFVLVLDEATMFKSPTARVHKVCGYLAGRADRAWGLTATLIKNSLIEGYGIYRVVVPDLFRMTPSAFISNYCIVRMQRVANGRQVPMVVGYRDQDVRRFRDQIDPFYLGRPKHSVATELPVLTTRDLKVGLTQEQAAKYREALDGLLEVGSGDEKETTQLTAITYCQEIVNHLGLLDFDNTESEKMDALLDLVSDGGDLEGEKVIVFTRFKKMVDIAIPLLEKAGVRCTRVTGSEDENDRRAAMKAFQDLNSETKVIFITMAGGDAINLQAAKALVFYDTPWSAGDYLQILGRMIRIGSDHDKVYAIHLLCKDTVDERVQEVLRKKMNLVEAVLGKRMKGEGDSSLVYEASNEVKDLFSSLQQDAWKGATK